MSLDFAFSVANSASLLCWVLLIGFPRARLTYLLAYRLGVPLMFAVAYLVLLVVGRDAFAHGGGFASLAQVMTLFTYRAAVLAGWLHYLAFDLFVGTRISRDSRRLGMPAWQVAPALLLTFMLGPVGLLTYAVQRRFWPEQQRRLAKAEIVGKTRGRAGVERH